MDKNKINIDSFIELAETPELHAPHCTRVYLTVDQQRFTIAICELPEEAEWWKSQLAKALIKIVDRYTNYEQINFNPRSISTQHSQERS